MISFAEGVEVHSASVTAAVGKKGFVIDGIEENTKGTATLNTLRQMLLDVFDNIQKDI